MESKPSGVNAVRFLLRGIFVFNLALVLASAIPVLTDWLGEEIRRVGLFDALFYWVVGSTLALPVLLMIEFLQRVLKRQKPLIERGLWIDAALVLAWWLYLAIGVARTAAIPIWAQ